MSNSLDNAIVTGAKGAVGRVVVQRYLEDDCRVFGFDRDFDSRSPVDEQASSEHPLEWVECDFTDADQTDRKLREVFTKSDEIDALVHCVGGYRWTRMADAELEDIDFLVDANLRSTLYMLRTALSEFEQQEAGRVVLISSQSSLNPGEGEGPYAGTKAALNALVKSAAQEVDNPSVTINAVLPSLIDTPANRSAMPDGDFSTWVDREELAELIWTLTRPVGSPLNGSLIEVPGGL